MLNRVIVVLVALLVIIQGLTGGMMDGGYVMLLIVLLGVVYGFTGVDAENATDCLVVTIAVGAAAGADVLTNIPGIGPSLDAMLDPASSFLYASVVSILIVRTVNRIKG